MAVVWIPSLMRDLTGGKETIEVSGTTVGEVIEAVNQVFPGFSARIRDSQGLRRGIAVAVDTHVARFGLAEPVSPASEVHFVAAIAGG